MCCWINRNKHKNRRFNRLRFIAVSTGKVMHPPKAVIAPPLKSKCTPSEPKSHPLTRFLSKLVSFAMNREKVLHNLFFFAAIYVGLEPVPYSTLSGDIYAGKFSIG